MVEDLELRCNFLSVDKKIARNSWNEFFKVGEEVGHEGAEDGDTATILEFIGDETENEIKVNTSKGKATLDFLIKL